MKKILLLFASIPYLLFVLQTCASNIMADEDLASLQSSKYHSSASGTFYYEGQLLQAENEYRRLYNV